MTTALITTRRLQLRQMHADDWPLFLRLNRDQHINRYIRDIEDEAILLQKFSARCHCEDFFAGDWLSLTIELNGEAVGLMGLCCIDNELMHAEVGYLLAPEVQGQGIATEALQALATYALNHYPLHKLVGRCVNGNTASARVLEKSGFQLEGILRHNHQIGGHWFDDRYYGLLVDDVMAVSA